MSNPYFVLNLQGLKRQDEDQVTGFCFERGAAGIHEDLKFIQEFDHYEPKTVYDDELKLKVYFESSPPEDFLPLLVAAFPDVVAEINQEESQDWLELWKKGFKAFALTGDIWVVPSWLEAPADAKKSIRIDPGLAFGTGTHETTQLAADMMAKHCTFQGQSVLDVGTGTGILAILAEHLGARLVEATEIVDLAREVAKENLQLNQAKNIKVHDVQIQQLDGVFDVVIANIIDGVLIELREQLEAKLADDGVLIMTGIWHERWPHFDQHFLQKTKLKKVERFQNGDWLGVILRP